LIDLIFSFFKKICLPLYAGAAALVGRDHHFKSMRLRTFTVAVLTAVSKQRYKEPSSRAILLRRFVLVGVIVGRRSMKLSGTRGGNSSFIASISRPNRRVSPLRRARSCSDVPA